MISIMKRFFDFCAKDNRNKFYRSLIDGLFMAIANGMKYPAAFLIIGAFASGNITGKTIWIAFLIMLVSIIFESIIRSRSVMLQCKGGYRECANKRIEIAEHLRFLPMGYFNENSLGPTRNIFQWKPSSLFPYQIKKRHAKFLIHPLRRKDSLYL